MNMKSKNGCRLVLIAVAAFMLSAAVVTISIESDDLTDAAPPYTDKDYLILRGSTTATYDLYKWDTVSGDWMTDTVMWDELPTIQSAVDIIKSDAAAEECSITFDGATTTAGIGTSTLEIGNTGIMFNNSDSGWSAAGVTLYGSLSATNSTSLTAVSAYDGMVINSYADIFQTSTDAQSNVIIIASSELNIFGGTMSSTNYGNAIYNMSGTVNISGGTVSTNWGITIRAFGEGLITIWDDPGMPGAPLIESGGLYAAIEIRDTGNEVERLNITGGTVRNLGSQVGLYLSTTYSSEAITNNSKGIVNISGDATVENYNPSGTTGGTITISNKGILNISENAVIHNYSTTQSCTTIINYNILNISGGRVSSTAGQSVENSYYASTIMSGGEISGRNGILNGGYVSIFDDLALPDKPIINTDGMGINIYRPGGGIAPDQVMVDITGGIIQSSNNAIFNQTYGIVNISGDTFIESTSSGSTGGAVRNSSAGTVNVFGEATIQNLAGDSNNRAVLNQSTGTVNIFSGELMTTAGNTIHNQSTGTVNISGGEVSSATGYAVYAQGTGKVTIWDDPSISDSPFLTTGGSSTIYVANATGNIEVRLEITGGTVQNTGATNNSCHAIYNASSGIVDISGDTTVQNYNSSGTAGNTWTINNSSNGIINMSDDVKVQNFSTDASARAINNNAGGEVNISGGDVTSIAGRTIHNQSTGTVNISGGEISSTTGYVIYAQGAGKITIFDDPSIQGSPLLTTGGSNTISIAAVSGNTDMRLEITGGTVQNTGTTSSSFYAVNNASAGSVNISGDAVVRNYNPAGTAGGTQTIYNNSSGTVNISENAKVQNFSTDTGARAIYNGVGAGTVNISGGEVTAAAGRAIHNNAAGTANITGGTVQNDSTEPTIYNYGAGKINISGGEVIATSGNAIYAYGAGTITVSDDPFIAGSPLVTSGGARTIDIRAISGNTDVRLEITGGTVENTSSTANGGQAIYNSSSGSVNISGDAMVQNYNPAGTAGNTWTISNGSTGELNISGDAVVQNCSTGSDARAIFNHSTGTVNISGGEVTVAAGRVIQNNATGTVNISGGIVQNSGTDAAIYNNAAGKVNITGGTVRNDGTGNAIYNSTGRINLGGAPDVIGDIYTAPNTLATLTDLTATPPQISFDPGVKTYDLMLSSEYNGAIAVIDGTTFLKNFVHKNTSDFTMKDNLAHLILVATVTITIGTSPDNLGIVPKVTDASSNPVTGTASGNKWTFQVEKSAEFTIEVPATDAGSLWNFKEWDDDPTASAVRIVSNGADSDKEYTAVYSRATVTITIGTSPDNLGIVPKVIDASSNPITGTASGNKWVFSVEKSAEFTIEIPTSDAGSLWNFKEWDDDQTTSPVRTVANGTDSDKEYTAVYIEMQPPGPPGSKVYYIDASADGNSTISPNGKVSVEGGASKTFTFSAAEGYRITEVSVDGVSLPQSQIDHGSYTFFNVNMNHTIVVKSAEGSGGNGDGESDDGNGDGDGNGTGNSNRESDGGEDEGNGTLVIKDNIWLWGPLIFIVLLVLLGLLIWFLLFRGRSGLIITVRKNREAVKGAAVNYSIKMDGKTENGTIMTNSKGKCRIKAKKDSVVTISMVAKDGDIATNLPVVMVMEHRREHLELMLG